MTTIEAKSIILNSVISVSLDEVDIISLRDSDGEFFRKPVTDITEINTTKRAYFFYLTEGEGNGDIVEIGLHGNGATTTLNSGTCYATQVLLTTKDSTQSLTIDWSLEVK